MKNKKLIDRIANGYTTDQLKEEILKKIELAEIRLKKLSKAGQIATLLGSIALNLLQSLGSRLSLRKRV